MSTATVVNDSRSEQRRAIDSAILEATEELRSILTTPSRGEDAERLSYIIKALTEARRAL